MKRSNFLPAPQAYVLSQMCVIINQAFGDSYGCYLVGSSLQKRDYRDVDVRFIMDDKQYDAMFSTRLPAHMDPFWSLLCTSVSLFLQQHTGLPVDFQIQQASRANAEYPNEARHPLGVFVCPTPRDYAAAEVDLDKTEETTPALREDLAG